MTDNGQDNGLKVYFQLCKEGAYFALELNPAWKDSSRLEEDGIWGAIGEYDDTHGTCFWDIIPPEGIVAIGDDGPVRPTSWLDVTDTPTLTLGGAEAMDFLDQLVPAHGQTWEEHRIGGEVYVHGRDSAGRLVSVYFEKEVARENLICAIVTGVE